jgi:short-subunit dehydrogenase
MLKRALSGRILFPVISRAWIVINPVTLITGASSGIGAEFARVFSAHGHRVALVARRADRLNALAAEITASGRMSPIVIPCDLGEADAAERIAAALTDESVEVKYLVNNAGYGLFGRAAELDRADQLAMIDLNIRALTDLTLRFVPNVIRLRGGILNVGSIGGFLPGPGMAVYYATKAFVLSFSEALRGELGPLGVRVTVICPGPVPSGFQARAGLKPGFDSAILNVSAKDVAADGYRALMANKRAVLPGLGIKIVPFLLRLFPRDFVLWGVSGFQMRRRS